MKDAENKEVKKGRDRYKDYMSQKYPDKVFDGENATDDLDELVASELEANASELEASRANSKKMVDLFNKSPREARFLLRLATEQDANPISILVEMYGPDLLDAMQSEEGKALISEASAKYLEVKATEEAGEAERMANYEKSVRDIAAFAEEKGLTDEQAVALFEKINQIGFDVIEGKFTREAMQIPRGQRHARLGHTGLAELAVDHLRAHHYRHRADCVALPAVLAQRLFPVLLRHSQHLPVPGSAGQSSAAWSSSSARGMRS